MSTPKEFLQALANSITIKVNNPNMTIDELRREIFTALFSAEYKNDVNTQEMIKLVLNDVEITEIYQTSLEPLRKPTLTIEEQVDLKCQELIQRYNAALAVFQKDRAQLYEEFKQIPVIYTETEQRKINEFTEIESQLQTAINVLPKYMKDLKQQMANQQDYCKRSKEKIKVSSGTLIYNQTNKAFEENSKKLEPIVLLNAHDLFMYDIKDAMRHVDDKVHIRPSRIKDETIDDFCTLYKINEPSLQIYLNKVKDTWTPKVCTIMSLLGYVCLNLEDSYIVFKRDPTIKLRFYKLNKGNCTDYVEKFEEL